MFATFFCSFIASYDPKKNILTTVFFHFLPRAQKTRSSFACPKHPLIYIYQKTFFFSLVPLPPPWAKTGAFFANRPFVFKCPWEDASFLPPPRSMPKKTEQKRAVPIVCRPTLLLFHSCCVGDKLEKRETQLVKKCDDFRERERKVKYLQKKCCSSIASGGFFCNSHVANLVAPDSEIPPWAWGLLGYRQRGI